MTRFEAQRKLGLFAPHDYVSAAVLFLSWLGWFICYSIAWEVMPWRMFIGWAVVNIILHLIWLTVIVYRGLVLVLDLHADVGLMPEAAARIAAGYFEGRVREGQAAK